ncbi:hypothetical protein GO296_04886 [Ralstonia solanacearum]|nr:hypothetical protein [Ralstonia solanacearum]
MRLDVLGHAEGAAVGAAAVVEAQRVAAGLCVGRQREARVGAGLARQPRGGGRHRRAGRVDHVELDVAGGRRGRLGRAPEVAADEFDAHVIARAVQRPVGEGIQLGVVDLAVVIEILGDEHATRAIDAEHVAALGRDVAQLGGAVGLRGAGGQHAHAVGPADGAAGHRLAALALGGPHHHPLRSALGHGHGIGDEQQRMRAVRADHRLDDVQPRRQLAHRNHHVADVLRHPLAAAAFELDVLGRRDRLGLPDRVAEAAEQLVALERRVLRGVRKARGRGHLVAHAELRRGFHRLAARGERQHALPGSARLAGPVVPQVGQRVGQALARVVGLDVDAVQVLLRLQEIERLRHAVDQDIGAAVAGELVLVFAARGLQAHHRLLVGAVARVRQQEERLAGERHVAAGGHLGERGVRLVARGGRLVGAGGHGDRERRKADHRDQIGQPTIAHLFSYRVKKARRNTPMKLGLPPCGCQRESFHCISSETGTARKPASVRVTVPVW